MDIKLREIRACISCMENKEELREVNRIVVDRLNYLRGLEAEKASASLHIGQLVRFTNSRTGGVVTIKIERINQKSVIGRDVASNTKWSVSPQVLVPA